MGGGWGVGGGVTCDFTCTNTPDRVKIENVELNSACFRVHGHGENRESRTKQYMIPCTRPCIRQSDHWTVTFSSIGICSDLCYAVSGGYP